MSNLAKQMQAGQCQKGMKVYAKGGAVKSFEKSKKDVEVKGMGKEGSKKEEAFDKTQMKCGGKAKKGGK